MADSSANSKIPLRLHVDLHSQAGQATPSACLTYTHPAHVPADVTRSTALTMNDLPVPSQAQIQDILEAFVPVALTALVSADWIVRHRQESECQGQSDERRSAWLSQLEGDTAKGICAAINTAYSAAGGSALSDTIEIAIADTALESEAGDDTAASVAYAIQGSGDGAKDPSYARVCLDKAHGTALYELSLPGLQNHVQLTEAQVDSYRRTACAMANYIKHNDGASHAKMLIALRSLNDDTSSAGPSYSAQNVMRQAVFPLASALSECMAPEADAST